MKRSAQIDHNQMPEGSEPWLSWSQPCFELLSLNQGVLKGETLVPGKLARREMRALTAKGCLST
ncbi:hypothetical protein DPMN_096252 [Dreissena polymorpha]|uniref:Uncharacterized protein n=1 Tax=Dreissena polymorpha TaxID=45954 RepID=A0A9D4L932_DREPO|nr:hypothetical protein DPMN_096252 [Dreissena polymorpha]